MAEQRLLPHLSSVCREALGGDPEKATIKPISNRTRLSIACKADVSQNTVDRFLKGETTPRGKDLDGMISAIAEISKNDWLALWLRAIQRGLEQGPTQQGEAAPGPKELKRAAADLEAVTKRLEEKRRATGS